MRVGGGHSHCSAFAASPVTRDQHGECEVAAAKQGGCSMDSLRETLGVLLAARDSWRPARCARLLASYSLREAVGYPRDESHGHRYSCPFRAALLPVDNQREGVDSTQR
jgi:hypothetical protein